MTKCEKAKIFSKALYNFEKIQNDTDLKRNRLQYTEYHIIHTILCELNGLEKSGTWTSLGKVAEWFKKQGFFVKEPSIDENELKQNPLKINYWIGCEDIEV